MLEKVIKVGRKGGEEYQVRNRLTDLVEDGAELGGYLWHAFRDGETWPLTNCLLWSYLANATFSVTDLRGFLHHDACPAPDHEDWWENKDADPRMLLWSEAFSELIKGYFQHGDVDGLISSLDTFEEAFKWRIECLLALYGHISGDALDDSMLEKFAVTWWLEQRMRREFDFFGVKDEAREGMTTVAIWSKERWYRALCDVVQEDDFPQPSFSGFFGEFAEVFAAATPKEVIEIAKKVDEQSLDPKLSRVIFEQHDADALAPEVLAYADDVLTSLEELPAVQAQIAVGLCCRLALAQEQALDERFDILVQKTIEARYGEEKLGYIPDSFVWESGPLSGELLEAVPLARREKLVLLQRPPWQFYRVCTTEAVARSIFEDGILLSSDRLESRWFLNNVFEEFGEIMARVAVEHLETNFSYRSLVLEWLSKEQFDFALPAIVQLLGADAKTRKVVTELLRGWGTPVLAYLPPLLTAKAKKTRTEAARLLTSFASQREAQKLAKDALEKEKDETIRALLTPLVIQYAEEGEETSKTRWGRDAYFQLEQMLGKRDRFPELPEMKDIVVPLLVSWCERKELEDAKKDFWKIFRHGVLGIESIRNIQLLFVARAEQLASQAETVDEKIWLQHADRLFEEQGWESLVPLGAGVLSWVVQWIKRDANRQPPTDIYYHDMIGVSEWEEVIERLGRFKYDAGFTKINHKLERAEELVKDAFRDASTRMEKFQKALTLVLPFEADGETFSVDEIESEFKERMEKGESIFKLQEKYERALLPVILRWLIKSDEEGAFTAEGWPTRSIHVDAWENLCSLVLHFQGPQDEVDEVDLKEFTKRNVWREKVDTCAPILSTLWKKIGAFGVQRTKDDMFVAHQVWGQLQENTWYRIKTLLRKLRGQVDLLKPLEALCVIFGQRPHHCHYKGEKHALELLSIVLDDPDVDDEEKLALVKRLSLAYQTFEVETLQSFQRWLGSRYAEGHVENEFIVQELVKGLGDKKKDVREEARKFLLSIGTPVLEHVRPLLTSKKITLRREAAEIVAAIPYPDNVPYIDKALEKEKKADIEAILRQARLKSLPLGDAGKMDDKALDEALQEMSENLPDIPSFASPSSLPACVWKQSQSALSEKAMAWLISQCMRETHASKNTDLHSVFDRLTQDSFDAMCAAIDKAAGTSVRPDHPWIEYILGRAASDAYIESLRERFYTLAKVCKESAFRLIDVFRARATEPMIFALIDWMQRAKRVETQERCRYALSGIASRKKLSFDGLLEQSTPDFGFDADGIRDFSEAGEGWTCSLEAGGQLLLHHQGESYSQLPVPKDADEQALKAFEEAAASFTSIRESIDQRLQLRHRRLEEAMLTERTWTLKEWKASYLEHPVLHKISLGIVFWDIGASKSFAVSEDAKLVDVEGNVYKPKAKTTIKIAHVTDLAEEEIALWNAFLLEREWPSPFSQMTRKAYHLDKPVSAFEALFGDMEYFSDGKELRKQTYRLGYKPEQVEGLVYQGHKTVMGGYHVSIEHDSYSVSRPEDWDDLKFRKISVRKSRVGEIPALVWSELMREFVLMERTLS
tara:strand:+ start:4895 stop:9553 length:4659 start_codon:yes stop_codon:yes gene_type:complete